jgi:hypothetical protein
MELSLQQLGELLDRSGGVTDGEKPVCLRRSAPQPPQRTALMQGDVIGPVALDFILRIVRRGVVDVPLVVDVLGMHAQDMAAHPAGLGVPADMVAALEGLFGRLAGIPGHDEAMREMRGCSGKAAKARSLPMATPHPNPKLKITIDSRSPVQPVRRRAT